MKTISINNELISILKKNTPHNENTVDLLIGIAPMNKEAAYRRLRGEMPFTAKEAICICSKFNISLDQLVHLKEDSSFIFHLSPIFEDTFETEYSRMVSEILKVLEFMTVNPCAFGYSAQNMIPREFAFKHINIVKLMFFKWIYQSKAIHEPIKFSNIVLPETISDLHHKYHNITMQINNSIVIDRYAFANLIKDINFFLKINLLTEDEVLALKQEAMLLLDEMEAIANKRYLRDEAKTLIYISQTYFNSNCFYIQIGEYKACALQAYGFNNLSCENPKICDDMKMWIESLIRYSILISGSGELYRKDFFKEQREIVSTL